MIVKLFCPKCVYEKTIGFDGHTTLEVPVPLTRLSDSGEYEVKCGKGHVSTVILDNVKFELLLKWDLMLSSTVTLVKQCRPLHLP